MRKILCIIIALFAMVVIFCGCGQEVSQSQSDLTYAAVYREAASLGYEGTLEEFLSLVKGCDGNGISDINIDSEGYLIVSYTKDNQQLNLGRIKGSDGVSISDAAINEDGELLITMSNNPDRPINLGKIVGEKGLDGTNGIDGKDGTNGVDGKDGKDGTNGANGLDGKDGTNGIDGKDGTNGLDGKDGTNGIDGVNGIDGTNGMSAYEIYKKYYPDYNKTEKEWLLDYIKGNLINKYNVTFHFYTGKEEKTVVLYEADKVTEPTSEETFREGYDFVCWKVGSTTGMVYDFNSPVEGNLELYAQYSQMQPTYVTKTLLGTEHISTNYFYTCGLSSDMCQIGFEATSGNMEYEIRYNEDYGNSIFKQGSKTFTSSQNNFFIDLTDVQNSLDVMYITIFYQNASGQLLVYPLQ